MVMYVCVCEEDEERRITFDFASSDKVETVL